MRTLAPAHPGEILKKEFLAPLGITNNEPLMGIRVPASRIDQIVQGRRSITADTRFGRRNTSATAHRVDLQSLYDLRVAAASIERIRREVVRRST